MSDAPSPKGHGLRGSTFDGLVREEQFPDAFIKVPAREFGPVRSYYIENKKLSIIYI